MRSSIFFEHFYERRQKMADETHADAYMQSLAALELALKFVQRSKSRLPRDAPLELQISISKATDDIGGAISAVKKGAA